MGQSWKHGGSGNWTGMICMEPKLNAAAATTNMGTRQEGGIGPSQEFQEAGITHCSIPELA